MDRNLVSGFEGNDGEEKGLEFTIPLTTDDFQEGQLGSQIYRNDKEHEKKPRSLVTADQKEDVYYFDVRTEPTRRMPRWVLFPDENNKLVPATLIVLNLCLQRHTPNARFKLIRIYVDVMDADMVHRNAHEGEIDLSHQPQVLDFQPRQFEGRVTELISQTHQGISLSGGAFHIGGGSFTASRRSPAIEEGCFTVHGSQRHDPASGVVWVMLEDKVKKSGVPAELSVGLVVQCTPGRRFAATFKLEADVWIKVWGTRRAVVGKKDEPLYFLPPADRSDFKEFPAAEYEKLSKLEHLRVSGGGDRQEVSLEQPGGGSRLEVSLEQPEACRSRD